VAGYPIDARGVYVVCEACGSRYRR
jgi:hypothetical protein